ncbi:MAG: hypothetical protein QOJ63_2804 [Solirubrobacteraceae bacterium]|nr:hypothetical protein [Solirubrobacteraceae bacterium]
MLIDESGSQSADSVKAEVNAASLLAQAELSNQSSFMVAGFASSNGKGQSAFVQYCPFITLSNYAARERASACAERAHRRSPKEGDDTDHAAALDFAVGQLADAPKGTARVVFLLTDGNLNVCDSPQYGRTCKARNREAKRQLDQRILPAARRAEIAIWPLGFGPVTRRDGLETFAQGGASGNEQCKGAKGTQPHAVVVGDSETILNVLLDLLASARCAQAGPPDGGLLEGGKTVSLEVKLPSIATDGAISVTKLDPRFTVEYFDPDGDEAIDRGEVDGQTFSRSGQNGQVEALRIENPKPGTWTVKVTAPAGRPAQRVLARAVWSGALQASIRISPVLPKPGQRVTVELYLITRYGVIRDPAELKGIVASAQVSGDFGSQTIALNDAGKDGDTMAGDGTFSGPFTMPGGKVGCFEVTGLIASPGVAADRRLYSLCSSKGSLSAIFELAVPKTVHGGDAVTGTIDFDNELGPQPLRLVVNELSNGAQVSVTPASFAVAQGATERKFELRIASGSPIGDLSGRLQLVACLGSSHRKPHWSGGDLAAAFEVDEALVAVRAVAVGDVAGEREREGVPVAVVGVLDDELADRQEMTFDAVQIAGVGRCRDELDVVGVGVGADVGGPVGAEVVLDPVDPKPLGVAVADLLEEREVVAAAPAWAQPNPEAVTMHVVGTEDVADAVRAGVGRALTLGPRSSRPARPGGRTQADRAHLIKRDHDPVLGRPSVERQDLGGLGLVVGVRAGLPRPCALKRQPGRREDPAEMRGRDLDDLLLTQVARQAPQRPARRRDPHAVGTGTGHRDDPSTLLGGDPARTPAPRLRVQRAKPPLVERRDDLAHMRLVGPDQRRDLRRAHPGRRRPTDQRALTLGLRRRLTRQPLESVALLGQQITHEHRRGTHRHLQDRDASLFAVRRRFPADRYETGH